MTEELLESLASPDPQEEMALRDTQENPDPREHRARPEETVSQVLAVNQVLRALGVKMECQVFRDNQDKRGQEVKMDQRGQWVQLVPWEMPVKWGYLETLEFGERGDPWVQSVKLVYLENLENLDRMVSQVNRVPKDPLEILVL